METFRIEETEKEMFGMLLPPCDTSVLSKVLDPTVPFISLIGFWTKDSRDWIEQHLPPLLGTSQRVEAVRIRRLEMDVNFRTKDFLDHLRFFSGRGLDLIQAARPLPEKLVISELKPESKSRVFREVGITLQFYLPHPHEHALLTSPSMDVLRKILATFSPPVQK